MSLLVDLWLCLVSAIHKIVVDPKKPRYLRMILVNQDQTEKHSGFAEFDTVEAAMDWRKEVTGQSPTL
jgi:hypothetical protein